MLASVSNVVVLYQSVQKIAVKCWTRKQFLFFYATPTKESPGLAFTAFPHLIKCI